MAEDPNWKNKNDQEKLDYLKLWNENLQMHLRALENTVQLLLEKLRQAGVISEDDQNGVSPRA